MHVPLGGREVAVTRQLLDRPRGGTSHREVRAERVPQRVRSLGPHVRATLSSAQRVAKSLGRQCSPVVLAQHPGAPQVAVLPKGIGEPRRHGDGADPVALGGGDVTLPVGSGHGEQAAVEVHVGPLQGHHLAPA